MTLQFTVKKKIDVIYRKMVRRYEQVPSKADTVMVNNMDHLFVKASITIWFEYSWGFKGV
jgi:hypothetical protein